MITDSIHAACHSRRSEVTESKATGFKSSVSNTGGSHRESPNLINIGTGTDVTIRELTKLVAEVTGFKGRITWDASKPDGTPRKLMDVSRLSALGWKAKTGLREGVQKTYASYLAEKTAGALRVCAGRHRLS